VSLEPIAFWGLAVILLAFSFATLFAIRSLLRRAPEAT